MDLINILSKNNLTNTTNNFVNPVNGNLLHGLNLSKVIISGDSDIYFVFSKIIKANSISQ